MMSWIAVTPHLKKGLEIVDQVDCSKFRLLVNRICQGLQLDNADKIFSSQEEEKLTVSLDLGKDDLILLLDTITLIYTQAAYSVVKPAVMEAHMKDTFSIAEDKIDIFVNAWITHAKSMIDVFRQKSIFPAQVNDINWTLNVQSSSSAIAKDARPTVLLQIDLAGASNSKLTVEMDNKSLSMLYHDLERIQSQLDSLK